MKESEDRGNPVLLLLDFQEGVCREDGPIGRQGVGAEVARRGVLETAQRALKWFRDQGYPVIHVRVAFDPEYHRLTSSSSRFASMRKHQMLREDDPWAQFCPQLSPIPGEPVINKGGVNAFIGTQLSQLLNRLRPTELVLCGVATNHVVESTARFATDSGFPVVILEDACASFDQELHQFAIERILPMYGQVTSVALYQERG